MGIRLAGYDWAQGGSKQVVYVDGKGHIQELVVQQGQPWSVADLSAIAGAPPAISTAIVGYDWAQGGSKQVVYVDGKGHIQELVVQQGQPWSVADLSAIAGAPPANISNGGIEKSFSFLLLTLTKCYHLLQIASLERTIDV